MRAAAEAAAGAVLSRCGDTMKDLDLSECPICGAVPFTLWLDEKNFFLVECPDCTTFTITESLVRLFRCALAPDDRDSLRRLANYLHNAGDDDDREITEESWRRLAG